MELPRSKVLAKESTLIAPSSLSPWTYTLRPLATRARCQGACSLCLNEAQLGSSQPCLEGPQCSEVSTGCAEASTQASFAHLTLTYLRAHCFLTDQLRDELKRVLKRCFIWFCLFVWSSHH